MENLPDIFKDFPGLINKIQGLSKTAKKSWTFQDVVTLWSKQKWLFWRAGFFPANQRFLKTMQIALIGWIKAGFQKKHFCFDHVNRLYKRYPLKKHIKLSELNRPTTLALPSLNHKKLKFELIILITKRERSLRKNTLRLYSFIGD